MLCWGLDACFLSFKGNKFSEACFQVSASTPVQIQLNIKGLQRPPEAIPKFFPVFLYRK